MRAPKGMRPWTFWYDSFRLFNVVVFGGPGLVMLGFEITIRMRLIVASQITDLNKMVRSKLTDLRATKNANFFERKVFKLSKSF